MVLRLAVVLAAIQAVFFLYVAIFPLTTVGDPAFDRPMLRERAWADTWQPWAFLMMVAALIPAFLAGRPRWSLAGGATLMLAAHALLIREAFLLTGSGALAVPRETALAYLGLSRPGCAILALASLGLIVWVQRIRV